MTHCGPACGGEKRGDAREIDSGEESKRVREEEREKVAADHRPHQHKKCLLASLCTPRVHDPGRDDHHFFPRSGVTNTPRGGVANALREGMIIIHEHTQVGMGFHIYISYRPSDGPLSSAED